MFQAPYSDPRDLTQWIQFKNFFIKIYIYIYIFVFMANLGNFRPTLGNTTGIKKKTEQI